MVDERSRLGDWEGDTVRGKDRSTLVTLVERKSLQVVIQKADRATVAHSHAGDDLQGRSLGAARAAVIFWMPQSSRISRSILSSWFISRG